MSYLLKVFYSMLYIEEIVKYRARRKVLFQVENTSVV